jgi:hypothetical protein
MTDAAWRGEARRGSARQGKAGQGFLLSKKGNLMLKKIGIAIEEAAASCLHAEKALAAYSPDDLTEAGDAKRLDWRRASQAATDKAADMKAAYNALGAMLAEKEAAAKNLHAESMRAHDARLIKATSAEAARACLPPEVAGRWARTVEVPFGEARTFLDRVAEYRAACETLRQDGARVPNALAVAFLHNLLVAYADTGIVIGNGDPWFGETFGQWDTSPIHLRQTVERFAITRPAPVERVTAFREVLRRIVKSGATSHAGFQAWNDTQPSECATRPLNPGARVLSGVA